MLPFLDEVQGAFDCGLYFVALSSGLLIPDACGAVEYPDLRNGQRYARWYDRYVETPPLGVRYVLNGDMVWKIRNGMIHETALDFRAHGFDRVLFTIPDRTGLTMDRNAMTECGPSRESAIDLNLELFLQRIIKGANRWVDEISADPEKSARLDGLIQLRPNGRAPFIVGKPLIS